MARAVVYFCTGNPNKLREVEQMMHGVPVEFRALDVDLPEIQGEPAEIAKAKCIAALEAHRKAINTSSSSSSNSSNSSSSSSSNSSSSNSSSSSSDMLPGFIFTEDTALCFNAFGGLPGPYDKSAYALTSICLADPNGNLHLFEGRCEGSVVEPRGKTTFGWDCVFEEGSLKKTFGEMEFAEKASVSHRGRAMKQLKVYTTTAAEAAAAAAAATAKLCVACLAAAAAATAAAAAAAAVAVAVAAPACGDCTTPVVFGSIEALGRLV
ncbi:hypothetical protein ACSSS7_003496 [Eimeria intestinalis]